MQFNFRYLGLIGVLVLFLLSCKKQVTKVGLTNVDDQIVMQSYLCPQSDSIFVSVTLASGTLSNRKRLAIDDLKNAVVTIESEGVSKNIPFKSSIIEFMNQAEVGAIFAMSQSVMNIESGKTYSINVNNGDKFDAYAKTTVPDSVFIDFDFVLMDSLYDNVNNVYYSTLDISIPDIKNQVNYYLVGLRNETEQNNLQIDSEWKLNDENDQLDTIRYHGRFNNFFVPTDSISIFVSNLSVDYYKFQKTLQQAISNGTNNPFVEPTTVYTNVVGGYGVVASMVLNFKPR